MRRWLAGIAVVAVAGSAQAAPVDTAIDVESDDDLRELHAAGAIDDDTRDALATLLARGVDLERADRDELHALPGLGWTEVDAILAYRAARGRIGDPQALVDAGVLDAAALRAIDGFLRRGAPPAAAPALRGDAAVRTRWAPGDRGPPPLTARIRLDRGGLSAGVAAAVTRLRPGAVGHDPARDALVAAAPRTALHAPRAFVRVAGRRGALIAGSYRVGFGLRLTFDTTGEAAPDGAIAADDIGLDGSRARACREVTGEAAPRCDPDATTSADPSWRPALFGLAASVRRGNVRVDAWASRARRSIYQYDLRDPARCVAADDCEAPAVYRAGPAPAPRLGRTTLPDVLVERVAGGRLAVGRGGLRAGVTGYAADRGDLVDGIGLVERAWPSGPVGAIGADLGVRRDGVDAQAEVARTHAGAGAIAARADLADRRHDLALSLRHLATAFVNPLARPEAAADELDGQRARDEAGARLRYRGRLGPVTARASGDAWRRLSTGAGHGSGAAGLDVAITPRLRPGVALAVSVDGVVTARVHVDAAPSPALAISLHAQRDITDRPGLAAWLIATASTPHLRLRARLRHRVDDLAAPRASSSAAAVDAGWRSGRHDVHVRADLGREVTAAAATTSLSLGLDLEVHF
jgi:hypothetical protein